MSTSVASFSAYQPPAYPPPTSTPDRAVPPSGVHLTRDADYLIQSFLPATEAAPPFKIPKLPLPYCAPQLTPGFDAPFCRAYNPILESVDLPQDQLLAFIDGLNLAMTASPPLRVVNIIGMAIGFVPYHWAMAAGAAIQIGAQSGMRILSKTLTDRYLRTANLRLFKPRGLSVRICTTAAMQHLVMHTPITAAPSKLTRVGRGVGGVLMKLPLPLASVIVHAVADKPPKVPAMNPALVRSKKVLAAQRRVAALEGHALQLDFDVPKAAKAEGVMDTMASWGVKFDSWRDGRKQTKAEELRLQLEREQERTGSSQSSSSSGVGGLLGGLGGLRGRLGAGGGLGGRLGAARRDNHRGAGAQAGGLMGLVGQTGLGSIVLSRVNGGGGAQRRTRGGPLELQVADADLIEHWQSAKVLWVVIMSSEIDQEIEGIELAESQNDEESIDERTWQAEMTVEREDLEFDAEVRQIVAQNEEASHAGK
ncbi:hypothetical protein DFH08DRAFT_846615 [Mycena albidolilacea]|uniref:Uncharacterized protein n=1 Tax=Mycena albidolilacea TaxID=1033008 RepID=A0AAD7AII8_9AGAR|nr:hypothetical protein DFH08DRAFT_846615 [Mycena albidolilacea]